MNLKSLDYPKLKLLATNSSINKSNPATNSMDVLLNFMDYQNNYEEFIRNSDCYESSSIILADDTWLKSKKSWWKSPIAEGSLLRINFGKNYANEMSYTHYGLVIRTYKKKLLVIPTTTNAQKIKKAYHPIANIKGDYEIRLAQVTEGFLVESVLCMDSAVFISTGRVLKVIKTIDITALADIKKHLFTIMFNSIEKHYKQLEKDNTDLQEKLKISEKKLLDMQDEFDKLKISLTDNQ